MARKRRFTPEAIPDIVTSHVDKDSEPSPAKPSNDNNQSNEVSIQTDDCVIEIVSGENSSSLPKQSSEHSSPAIIAEKIIKNSTPATNTNSNSKSNQTNSRTSDSSNSRQNPGSVSIPIKACTVNLPISQPKEVTTDLSGKVSDYNFLNFNNFFPHLNFSKIKI